MFLDFEAQPEGEEAAALEQPDSTSPEGEDGSDDDEDNEATDAADDSGAADADAAAAATDGAADGEAADMDVDEAAGPSEPDASAGAAGGSDAAAADGNVASAEPKWRTFTLKVLMYRKDMRSKARRRRERAAAAADASSKDVKPLHVPELNETVLESLSELVSERLESIERIVHGARFTPPADAV